MKAPNNATVLKGQPNDISLGIHRYQNNLILKVAIFGPSCYRFMAQGQKWPQTTTLYAAKKISLRASKVRMILSVTINGTKTILKVDEPTKRTILKYLWCVTLTELQNHATSSSFVSIGFNLEYLIWAAAESYR